MRADRAPRSCKGPDARLTMPEPRLTFEGVIQRGVRDLALRPPRQPPRPRNGANASPAMRGAMEHEMEEVDLAEQMEICRVCLGLRGPFYDDFNGCERVQRCACEPKEAPWNAFDYNQRAALCRCCAAEVVRSGSRWSAFFCRACQQRVVAYDRSVGEVVIPIGRHSIMNANILRLKDAQKRQRVERLVGGLLDVSDRTQRIGEHWRAVVSSTLGSMPEPSGALLVPMYIAHAHVLNVDRVAIFARLVAAVTVSGDSVERGHRALH